MTSTRSSEAVLMLFRTGLRRRWRSWLGLAVLGGLAAGAVIAFEAGARRAETAYPRFLVAQRASDVTILNFAEDDTAVFDPDDVARLPAVAEIATAGYGFIAVDDVAVVASDGDLGVTVDRPKVVRGRLADPQRAREVTVGFALAEKMGIDVGDPIELVPEAGLPFSGLSVVGVTAAPGDFPPSTLGYVLATPAFRQLAGDLGGSMISVRLERGVLDVDAFLGRLARLGGGQPLQVVAQRDHIPGTRRSIDMLATALRILALLAALVSALVLSQLLERQAFLDAPDQPILLALGMTRWGRWAADVVRGLAMGLTAGVTAVVVAGALSPAFPTGLARIAEPHRGLDLDVTVLVLGSIVTAVSVVVLTAVAAWPTRLERATLVTTGPGVHRSAELFGRLPLPVAAVTGTRLALDRRRGAAAAPVRTALLGVGVGIAAVCGALTFGTSLDHLLDTPELYGQSWDAELTHFGFGPSIETHGVRAARRVGDIDGLSIGESGIPSEIDGVGADVITMDQVFGHATPPVTAGRLPTAADEIVLAIRTLARVDKALGSTVDVSLAASAPVPMRVVGEAVLPPASDLARIGEGALVSIAGQRRLAPQFEQPVGTMFLDIADGANDEEVVSQLQAEVLRSCRALPDPSCVHADDALPDLVRRGDPADIVNFGRVASMPTVLAVVLSLLAMGTLAHVVMSTVRRRSRDVAVLKVLGFDRNQIRQLVSWQAVTVVVVAMAGAVPLGVGVGHLLWGALAHRLGVVAATRTPTLALVAVWPAAVLLAVGVAAMPARVAARSRPAETLRQD